MNGQLSASVRNGWVAGLPPGEKRRRCLPALAAVLCALAAAPALQAIDPGDLTCPDGGTSLRWETFGLPFFQANCSICHDWTHYNLVYGIRYTLLSLVVNGQMPLGAVVSSEDRARLSEFVACGMPRAEPRCPPAGTALSWGNFGFPFFVSRCGQCHSRDLSGPDRNGAPPDQNFDDLDTVVKFASRILVQVETDQMPPGGFVLWTEADDLREWIACGAGLDSSGSRYQRADPNDDGVTDISDAVAVLDFLFQAGPLDCLDSADVDGSGVLDLTDPIFLLEYLYRAGPPPPPPFYGICGGTLRLGCDSFASCPDP